MQIKKHVPYNRYLFQMVRFVGLFGETQGVPIGAKLPQALLPG